MKTLPTLIIGLILSLSLAGQAFAMQNTLPIQGINKVLQMHIDQKVVNSLNDERYFQHKRLSLPVQQEKLPINQPELFHVPDCLCHLYTRVL